MYDIRETAFFFLFLLFQHKIVVVMAYEQRPLRILAIGDSLTAGYYHNGGDYHPYANHLSDLFASAKIPVIVHEKGVSGELVVPFMLQRFKALLANSNHSPYDWIIILGGTNDLGHNSFAKRIFYEGLKPMYDMALRHGQGHTKLVVMTVFENAHFSMMDAPEKERQVLNEMIRSYAINHKNHDNVCLVDLDKGIPHYDLNDSNKQEFIWDDKVHLKPVGYDIMATLVFEAIKNKPQERNRVPKSFGFWRILMYSGVLSCTLILLKHTLTYFHVCR
jgi:lysophospholipase L1-like esterase